MRADRPLARPGWGVAGLGGPVRGGLSTRLLAICADVRDPGNAGTVIRTADAAGADAVVLAGHSVDAYNPKTVRATVGSLFHLPDRRRAGSRGRGPGARAGLTVLAADGAGRRRPVRRRPLPGPTAWLFGNEAWGLPRSSRRWPTTGSPSRSTAGRRASTSHRRGRCASTPRAPSARAQRVLRWTGVPTVILMRDPRPPCPSWGRPLVGPRQRQSYDELHRLRPRLTGLLVRVRASTTTSS